MKLGPDFFVDNTNHALARKIVHTAICECDLCNTLTPEVGLDPIQNNCKYGWVLPDRCRYNRRLGCDCGAYPGKP